MTEPSWQLICPATNWQQPLPLDPATMPLLLEVGHRLGLRVHQDDAQHKFYLGNSDPVVASPPSGAESGFLYPSGKRFPKAQLSEAEAARYGTTGIYQAAPLLQIGIHDMLSEHFQAGEFFPHDPSYQYLRVSAELVRRLEVLRHQLGDRPLVVHSAYRPPDYNRSIGGVSNSAHMDGLAADVSCPGVDTATLHGLADVIFADGGLGYYPTQGFCHCDVRGSTARWTG